VPHILRESLFLNGLLESLVGNARPTTQRRAAWGVDVPLSISSLPGLPSRESMSAEICAMRGCRSTMDIST